MRALGNTSRRETAALVALAALVIAPTAALSILAMATLDRARASYEREVADAYARSAEGLAAQAAALVRERAALCEGDARRFAASLSAADRLALERDSSVIMSIEPGSTIVAPRALVRGIVVVDSRWRIVYPAPPAEPAPPSQDIQAALDDARRMEAASGAQAALPLYRALAESGGEDVGDGARAEALAGLARAQAGAGLAGEAAVTLERLASMPVTSEEVSLPLLARYQLWATAQDETTRRALLAACCGSALTAPAAQVRFCLEKAGGEDEETARARQTLAAREADERLARDALYLFPGQVLSQGAAGRGWAWRSVTLDGRRYVCGALGTGTSEARTAAMIFFEPEVLERTAIAPALSARSDASDVRLEVVRRAAGDDAAEGVAAANKVAAGDEIIVERALPEPFDFWSVRAVTASGGLAEIAATRVRLLSWAVALAGLAGLAGAGGVLYWARRRASLARLQTDFLASVTHELKTPLTGIRSLAETLLLGRVADAGRQSEFIAAIAAESNRLSRLVGNVLDFARMERGASLRREEADLAEVVRAAAESFAAGLPEEERGCLAVETPEGPVAALVDRDCMERAILNLLDNAYKYSSPPRRIALTLAARDGAAEVTVEDNGIGVPRAHERKVWRRFYRVDSSLAARVQGAGLGLALVKAYAEAHGGAVALRSRLGEGSAFTVRIPLMGGDGDE